MTKKAVFKGSFEVRVSSEAQLGKDLLPSTCGVGQDLVPCRLSEWGPQLPAGCQLPEAPSSCPRGLLHMVAYITKASKGKKQESWLGRRKLQAHVTITKVTSYWPLPCLRVRSKSDSSHLQGRDYPACGHQEVGISGDHLGSIYHTRVPKTGSLEILASARHPFIKASWYP